MKKTSFSNLGSIVLSRILLGRPRQERERQRSEEERENIEKEKKLISINSFQLQFFFDCKKTLFFHRFSFVVANEGKLRNKSQLNLLIKILTLFSTSKPIGGKPELWDDQVICR